MPTGSSYGAWIILAGVLGGVGFLLGYFVGSEREATSLPPDVFEETVRDVAPARVRAPPREEVAPSPDARLETRASTELEPLRSAIDALPPPEVPVGSGTITGVVKTETGEGLAGVTLVLTPQRQGPQKPRQERRDSDDVDIPAAVRSMVDRLRFERLSRHETRSGPEGAFRFEAVPDLDCRVRAEREGYRIRAAGRKAALAARPGTHLEFVAEPVAELTLAISLPDGTAPDQARVELTSGGRSRTHFWRPDRPTLTVEPGTYQVSVTAGEAQEYSSEESRTSTLVAGAPLPTLVFQLQSRGGIRGRIVFAAGQPLRSMRVYALRSASGTPVDADRLISSGQSTWVRAGDGDSVTFTFPNLTPGHYQLGVTRHHAGKIVTTAHVEVTDCLAETEIAMPPLRADEYVVVRALGPDGSALANYRLSSGHATKSVSAAGGGQVIDRSDGTKWLVLDQESSGGGSDASRHWVVVEHPTFGSVRAAFERGSAEEVRIRFEPPASVEIRLESLVGSDYENRVKVMLVSADAGTDARSGRSLGGKAQRPDARGFVTLTPVQPGAYEVVLQIGDRFMATEIARTSVQVTGGRNRVRVRLPALHSVALEGVSGPVLIRRKDVQRWGRFVPASGGRMVIDGLPAGDYEVRSGQKSATFVLPGPSSIRLE